MNDNTVTITGNLVDDPRLRYTPRGVPVADFRVASTSRQYDQASAKWRDGDTVYLTCTVWRQAAENVANSLIKGARVVVTGRLTQREYRTAAGDARTVVEVDVDEVGASLRAASVRFSEPRARLSDDESDAPK